METQNEIKKTPPLIQLSGIGKIYVSAGNVAVGIRGINLSFDRGEFVAITGQSGSGKSTLLNVISGMDTYEEGELFINGNPTSHYIQKDWEEYRKEYISFIFQDYNIIESFTVLQNVELALMNIEDLRERHRRAVELVKRVGLEEHMNHKGSKLSGGQKQRTVIARALAKDSPVILADEPTGNLDSQTSKEIIALLKEVSRDKLVIVVTHNYEQLENAATRHIRIFDGSVESDRPTDISPDIRPADAAAAEKKDSGRTAGKVKNGFALGAAIFTSRPKLTLFLCLLLFVGTAGIFFATSLCGDAFELFEPHYMFTVYEGRVVLTRTDGNAPSDEDLSKLPDVVSRVRYDILLDRLLSVNIEEIDWRSNLDPYIGFSVTTDKKRISVDAGKLPEKPNEVFLMLPIGYRAYFGSKDVKITSITYGYSPAAHLTVTGVGYYSDNNRTPVMLVTPEGFDLLSILYLTDSGKLDAEEALKPGAVPATDDFFDAADPERAFAALSGIYNQASVFYRDNRAAEKAIPYLRSLGYVAALSDSTYEPSVVEVIEGVITAGISLFLWLAALSFLAFFIHLCTSRSVAAFRPDMAIMRSMGIPTAVIRIGIFVRMLLSVIPGFAAVVLIAVLIFTSPAMNARFTYLYAWQYAMIFGGTLILVILVTRKQIRKLFSDSVKKTIRGGSAE
ncbi:MAG: ABC transporter ATP-binding protein [Clostridia bacterium]|nr:ABC transporter ATP-binding protein [Clostridia bacterium]